MARAGLDEEWLGAHDPRRGTKKKSELVHSTGKGSFLKKEKDQRNNVRSNMMTMARDRGTLPAHETLLKISNENARVRLAEKERKKKGDAGI